ncbi:MAG TPA: hypothetical protein V6D14_11300 [Coleofasciculaceae cyanobacterium]
MVRPEAIATMKEIGIDITNHTVVACAAVFDCRSDRHGVFWRINGRTTF